MSKFLSSLRLNNVLYVDIPYYAYHFTVSGHLDFFHILAAFLNNAARNHGVQISL